MMFIDFLRDHHSATIEPVYNELYNSYVHKQDLLGASPEAVPRYSASLASVPGRRMHQGAGHVVSLRRGVREVLHDDNGSNGVETIRIDPQTHDSGTKLNPERLCQGVA